MADEQKIMNYISDIVRTQQVILLTARAEIDVLGKNIVKDNVMTSSWHTPLAFEPFLYGVVLDKDRFTLELIRKSGVFCINFLPYKLKDAALFCGTQSGRHIDKFKESGLKTQECDKIDCTRLKDAAAFLECELVNEVGIGDHVLIVGKVVNSKFRKDTKRLYYFLEGEFKAM